ncbi:hypothetical protein KDU71_05235 [Carboxylicivirga sediminis]|uniref:Uncharacterized protein n=1 Tax=Carboxylicivirga sediminis TaxID=2006564 RepID=A0A941F1B9_9BACT|nr:hypothetical protein [Carboxylicivirga sediminis]MBR8534956.1 hypothetical protein [Carboxylicivirga sediminis]
MKKHILLGLLLSVTGQLFAQLLEYRRGYIIDKDSVKRECMVKYRSEGGIVTKSINKDDGEKQTYLASEVLGYGQENDHYIVLKDVRTKVSTIGQDKHEFMFAKLEVEGRISLYSTVVRYKSSSYGFNYERVYIAEKLPEYSPIQFRRQKKKQLALLVELMKDLPEVQQKIGTKKLREDELKQLIRYYNSQTNKDQGNK